MALGVQLGGSSPRSTAAIHVRHPNAPAPMLAPLVLALAAADTLPPDSTRATPAADSAIVAAAAGPRPTASLFAPTADREPLTAPLALTAVRLTPTDTIRRRRPRAIEYSDWYARRLTIHRIGSYTMIPLFAAEYALGQRLLSTSPRPAWVRPTHIGVAVGTAALFGINTITGAWNLWDSRHDENGRTRRIVHTALMLASEAGFAYTGAIAGDAHEELDAAHRHKNAALASMGISIVGTGMMWFWKD